MHMASTWWPAGPEHSESLLATVGTCGPGVAAAAPARPCPLHVWAGSLALARRGQASLWRRQFGGSLGAGFQVKAVLDDILEKIPETFNMAEIMAKAAEKTPYVVVAFQECERMNILTNEMRRSLKELNLGLKVRARSPGPGRGSGAG